jgi:hypothetical protein
MRLSTNAYVSLANIAVPTATMRTSPAATSLILRQLTRRHIQLPIQRHYHHTSRRIIPRQIQRDVRQSTPLHIQRSTPLLTQANILPSTRRHTLQIIPHRSQPILHAQTAIMVVMQVFAVYVTLYQTTGTANARRVAIAWVHVLRTSCPKSAGTRQTLRRLIHHPTRLTLLIRLIRQSLPISLQLTQLQPLQKLLRRLLLTHQRLLATLITGIAQCHTLTARLLIMSRPVYAYLATTVIGNATIHSKQTAANADKPCMIQLQLLRLLRPHTLHTIPRCIRHHSLLTPRRNFLHLNLPTILLLDRHQHQAKARPIRQLVQNAGAA